MDLQKNQKGFIFSLDGTLALLITMTALVGVAQIGASSNIYKQHGYVQLERYANDGLRVLSLNGSIQKAIELENSQQSGKAREIIRKDLLNIMPKEIQFKMMVGKEGNICLDNVYPSSDNKKWEKAMKNAKEKAVSAQVTIETPKPEPIILHVWRGGNVEE